MRTGDTPQSDDAMRKRPPHIVVTTPESLYILLGSESGREMLATTRTVIVDEIHAMAGRSAVCTWRCRWSASRRSPDASSRVLAYRPPRSLSKKSRDSWWDPTRWRPTARPTAPSLMPVTSAPATCRLRSASPLEAVMSGEVWMLVYDRLAELVAEHRTTLVFVNTRRHAERIARHLSERIGAEFVTAHHGSMAKELRLDAESRLKEGELQALVATASLELGIDIGDVDLVCQIALATLHRCLPAARRSLRPLGRRHPQGPAVPPVAR